MPLLRLASACFTLLLPSVMPPASAKTEDPGEYSFRSTPPLDPAQRTQLRALIASHPEAASLFQHLQTEALPLLVLQPRPLRVLHYEGLVNTDPRRIATVTQLREMAVVAILVHYWQASDDPRAATTLRRFLLAWAHTYAPTGNDVNENKFYPLFVAYDGLRPSFPPAERDQIDAWLLTLGHLHAEAVRSASRFTNRYTKHVRLLALLGRILDHPDWQASATTGIQRFVQHSLRADGTSYDLELRDTLTYHNSALRPIIELASLAGPDGPALYTWQSPDGGSLKQSVDYVVPYASGAKTREEWRHTRVALDRRRAAEGLEAYRPGRLYEPLNALPLLEEASAFDPSLLPLVLKLHQSDASHFASWTMLLNAALRPSP